MFCEEIDFCWVIWWHYIAFAQYHHHGTIVLVVWLNGSALVSINKVNRHWGGWPCPGLVPGVGQLSLYVTSHPGQLNLAIPSWVGTMSISQRAVMPCGWGVKADMVRVWVAGKTVWSHCYTRAISECFRDKELIIKRYIAALHCNMLNLVVMSICCKKYCGCTS